MRLSPILAVTCLCVCAGCPPDDEGDDELFDPFLNPPPGTGNGAELPAFCALPSNKPIDALPAAIYFGTRAPTLVPLDDAQQNAVVGITDRFTADTGSFCTGTLISDDVVLTAQHCTEGWDASDLVVLFGADEFDPILVIGAVEKSETDPDTDIAVLRLESAPPQDVARPIPIEIVGPTNDNVGTLVEAAGYGDTHDGSEGRYFVTELFDSFDADFITVNGEGKRGVCFGDSGGPLMHVSDASRGGTGDVRVLGVLSYGDKECTNFDSFSRADARRAFIEEMTGPTPIGLPEPCPANGSVTLEGTCSAEQALVTYCSDDGFVVRDACAAGEICGLAPNATATVRCIPIAENPCGEVTRFGSCSGELLTWCNANEVNVRACDACSERCKLVDEAQGFACVPSDCGELDATGICDGDVARWCNDDARAEELACEDGCQFLGPFYGNYCYDPVACEGHTYQGSCDGNVLTWCEDNEVFVVNCAFDDAACVFVDDELGFICE